jgi:hypothetical protein
MVLRTADGMLQLERPKAIQQRILEEQITAKNQMRVVNPDLFYCVSTEQATSEDPTTKGTSKYSLAKSNKIITIMTYTHLETTISETVTLGAFSSSIFSSNRKKAHNETRAHQRPTQQLYTPCCDLQKNNPDRPENGQGFRKSCRASKGQNH